jgi:gliding motility-associated-like protein
MKHVLVLFTLLTCSFSFASVIRVTSTGDNGAGTLRDAIDNLVASGDTVIIDVKGEILLQTPITFTSLTNVTVMGPSPKHCSIRPSGTFAGSTLFQINSCTNLKFYHFGFVGNNSGDIHAVTALTNPGPLHFERILFKDFLSLGNGGGIKATSSNVRIVACSFINNDAAKGGGASFTSSTVIIENSTFSGNAATNQGGAVYVESTTNIQLIHNTFVQNTSPTQPEAYLAGSPTDVTFLQGNAIGNNGTQAQFGGGGSFNSGGGNAYRQNSVMDPMFWIPGAGDVSTTSLNFHLKSPILEDGYGLMYYTIVNPASALINIAPATTLTKDARMAPRILKSSNVSALAPDAGACEYTPLRVTLSVGGSGTVGTLPWAVDVAQNFNAVNYIEFDFNTPPVNIAPPSQISLDGSYIIDGFSQSTSAVPGPALEGATALTPASIPIVLNDGSGIFHGIVINGAGFSSRIAGLRIINFDQYGIVDYSSGSVIEGCEIGITSANVANQNLMCGIYLFGSNAMVGGPFDYQRNVVSGNAQSIGTQAQIFLDGGILNNKILGNIVGLNNTGTNFISGSTSYYGIMNYATGTRIGDINAGNIIGGVSEGITCSGCDNLIVQSNLIGMAYDGVTAKSNVTGIYLKDGSLNSTIGGIISGQGNIVSGNSSVQMRIDECDGVNVRGNYFGPDKNGILAPVTTTHGIYVAHASADNINIGGTGASDGNLISGNNYGIFFFECGIGAQVLNNKIGTTKDGDVALANIGGGIHIGTNVTGAVQIGAPGAGNLISGNYFAGTYGINVLGGNSNVIHGNKIGLDITGNLAVPNYGGINISGPSNTHVGGLVSLNEGNIIAGNTMHGIHVQGASDLTSIQGNRIGMNEAGTGSIPNGISGIYVADATNTSIGGGIDYGNVISGMSLAGQTAILLGSDGSGTSIQSNLIGCDPTGNIPIPNRVGISIEDDHQVYIGGNAGKENFIVASTEAGVEFNSPVSSTMEGNSVGRSNTGVTAGMSNEYGVIVQNKNAVIGNTIPNFILNSNVHGIYISGDQADSVFIAANYIGTDAANALGIGNAGDGIHIDEADATEIGAPFYPNIIIGNDESGIRIQGDAQENYIHNNIIADQANVGLTNSNGIYLLNGATETTIGGLFGVSGNNFIGDAINDGIRIEEADNNYIYGNKIGTDGNSITNGNKNGIKVDHSIDIYIGESGGYFNVISGNNDVGILLDSVTNSLIYSNLIGVNLTGNGPVPNTIGIQMTGGSQFIEVGQGNVAAHANTISANDSIGIQIDSPFNGVYRNYIGTTSGGLGAMNGQDYGIAIGPLGIATTVGGDLTTEGNLLTSNEVAGILLEASGCQISGNIIGVSPTYVNLGTQQKGIVVSGVSAANSNIGAISGSALEYGNVIMNHGTAGIEITDGANNIKIIANFIGVNPSGNATYTQEAGVLVTSTAGIDNMIGEDLADGENIISGNSEGIHLNGAVHTFIYNNRIGTNILGTLPVPNENGIQLTNAGFNTIGGNGLQQNLISGNSQNGILMSGASSTQNEIVGNLIGCNLAISASLPNLTGIRIENGATNNFIGQPGFGNGNKITGNNEVGILVDNASSNLFYNNRIGLPYSNVYGVVLQNGATLNEFGGAPAYRNYISNNDSIGIAINGADNNTIAGNFIGTNEIGNAPEPNVIGVYMNSSVGNNIGTPAYRNIISSNTISGITIENSASNFIKNNYIGTDTSGNAIFAASGNGVGIHIKNSNDNLIGGNSTIDHENVICNNVNQGIFMEGAVLNELYGNKIGISKNGILYFGNFKEGIHLENGSDNNTFGAPGTGLANSIAANSVGIYAKFSDANIIASNFIGNNTNGTGSLSGTNNQAIGIHLDTASTGNIIEELNIIGGNTAVGVKISGNLTENNVISGNYFGIGSNGVNPLSNGVTNLMIADSAHQNLIGGQTLADRNYFGGNMQQHIYLTWDADSNQIAGNYINLGTDGATTYNTVDGIYLTVDSKQNIIGGGLPGEGNTIVGLSGNGIRLDSSPNTKILGNRIGIKPDSSPGPIGNSGVLSEGADYTWIGAYLPGSDSMNIITNCNTGINLTTVFVLNSSYGNVIGGNAIYNNNQQGIDLLGDGLVMPNDTNNANIFIDNGGIDRPEIISAWECGINGNTWVGFKFYSSNNLPGYHVEFYRNPNPDGSGFGEGEIYIGDYIFNPVTNYDTISIDLGQSLPAGTVLTATITGVWGNTSEFSQQFVVTLPPPLTTPVITDETCLGANNGFVNATAVDAYAFSFDGGTTWLYGNGSITDSLPTGSYTMQSLYLNGCIQSQPVVLNSGLPLPFSYNIIPDTCGLGLGEILIDTISTNLAGGSNSYTYTFNNGAAYLNSIDTVAVSAGVYTIGLLDNVLGCYSSITPVTVAEINEVEDESFVYPDFCSNQTPLPTSVATSGGTFTFENTPGDGALIDGGTGLMSGTTIGNSYSIIYTVGICFEKDTILVTALDNDDPSFAIPDFCDGSAQTVNITGLAGGTFSFDPVPGDGATIDPVTGIIDGNGGTSYGVKYVTNGTCPDSTTVTVNVLFKPAAPQITAVDSVYCPGDALIDMSVNPGTSSVQWTQGSASGSVVGTNATFNPVSINTGDNYYYSVLIDGTCLSEADSINYYLSDVSVMSASADQTICLTSLVQLDATGGVTYLWQSNDDLSQLDIANPEAIIDGADEYIVTITDLFGCSIQDTVRIDLLPADSCEVEIYTAFSPNNDGTNDFWHIDGIEGYSVNTVTLFSRWGDILIKFENYNNSTVIWDGRLQNGNPVGTGTYYYVIDVEGTQSQAGWVQVVY